MKKTTRAFWYLAGLALLALGSALSVRSELGVTATASIGYVLAAASGLSLGLITMLNFMFFIAVQLLFTCKSRLRILMQLPFSVFFSAVLDFCLDMLRFEANSLIAKFALLVLGVLLTAAGVFLTVSPGIVPTAPDGFVETLAGRFGWRFGVVKNIFDLVSVTLAAGVGLLCVGSPKGIGIGTLFSALLIGPLVGVLMKRFGNSFAKPQQTSAKAG